MRLTGWMVGAGLLLGGCSSPTAAPAARALGTWRTVQARGSDSVVVEFLDRSTDMRVPDYRQGWISRWSGGQRSQERFAWKGDGTVVELWTDYLPMSGTVGADLQLSWYPQDGPLTLHR